MNIAHSKKYPPQKHPPDPAMLALRYPFDCGLVALDAGATVLAVNPVAPLSLDVDATIDIWQWWKHIADALAGQGNLLPATGPDLPEIYDAVLIRLPRQREEGQFVIARAWACLKPGGLLMVAAANDSGGARLEKDLSWLGDGMQNLSKYKSRVVWARKDADDPCPAHWLAEGAVQKYPQTALWTQPGLFSWNRIDKATALLADYLPRGLAGVAADLGCGYGALSLALLERNPHLKTLHVVDADARALDICQKNIADHYPDMPITPHWLDLSRPVSPLAPFDLVVMNPPFHSEKALAIDTGQAFIANAAALLKKQGVLLMVANAHLPYEGFLAQCFSLVEKKFEGQGFKIFSARL